MTDPLSLTGTAVGIVSLGLTVCQSLVSYYNSWASQDDQVKEAMTRVEELENVLELLNGRLARLPSKHEAVSSQVEKLIISCKASVNKLEDMLEKCRGAGKPSNLKEKLQTQKRKVLFPFKTDTLDGIKATSRDIVGILNIALEALQVDIQVEQTSMMNQHFSRLNDTVLDQGSAFQANLAEMSDQSKQTQESMLLHQARIMQELLSLRASQERLCEALKSELYTFQSKLCRSPRLLEETCNDARQLGVLGEQSDPAFLLVPDKIHAPRRSFARQRQCTCTIRPRVADGYNNTRNTFSVWYSSSSHSSTCPLRYNHRKINTFGLGLKLCGFILSSSIQTTLTVTRGAGGCSISSALRYRAIVPDYSPAFKLLGLVYKEFDQHARKGQDFRPYVDRTLRQLEELFRNGEASPTDIRTSGGTLLHAILSGMILFEKPENNLLPSYHRLLSALIDMGVPPNEIDYRGHTFMDYLLSIVVSNQFYYHSTFDHTVPYLLGNTEAEFSRVGSIINRYRPKLVDYFGAFDEVMEALELGCLSRAVLSKSETKTLEILSDNPRAIFEKGYAGQNPLHYSCNWPSGLSILLRFSSPETINQPDDAGLLPLCHACALNCKESVQLLLAADSALISPMRDGWSDNGDVLKRVFCYRLDTLIPYIINALVDRRDRLRRLALEYLPGHVYDSLGIPEDRVLDKQAYTIYTALVANNVRVPASLYCSSKMETVYHSQFLTPKFSELLFEAGFRDIDGLDSRRVTPVMSLGMEWLDERAMCNLPWLLSKGADIDCRLPNLNPGDPEGVVAHQLATNLANVFYRKIFYHFINTDATIDKDAVIDMLWSYSDELQKILASVFAKPVFDGCLCFCSSGGCCPATKVLRVMSLAWCYQSHNTQLVRMWFIDWITERVLEREGWNEVRGWLSVEIIRYETFSSLGLRHTCRDMQPYSTYPTQEERMEIREEERFLAAQLDDLVPEFVAKYAELGVSLLEFFEGYWKDRMEQILDDSGSVDEEKVHRIKELGVVLEE